MRITFYLYISGVLLAGCLLAGCNRKHKDQPNLLIITADTTRADRLGCYGYPTAHTPNMDQLAQDGVLLKHAISCVPMTLPSHATIFTGLIPPEHGIRVNAENGLSETIPTLAEILLFNDYITGAVISSTVLDSSYGLNRGFLYYSDNLSLSSNVLYRSGEIVADHSIAWLDSMSAKKTGKNWFLWSHFFDPHEPLTLHAEFADAVSNNAYDSEVSYMDKHIGRIIQWLKENDQFDNTVIVVVGDHGEGLGDHGENTHAFYIYQSTQHVPCIITWKNRLSRGSTLSPFISLADIMPTLIDLMGVDAQIYKPRKDKRNTALEKSLTRSFARSLINPKIEPASRPCYMESLWGFHMLNWAPLFGVIDQNHKLIRAPRHELFNLNSDPEELTNIYTEFPRIADNLSVLIEEIEQSVEKPDIASAQISQQKLNLIKSLGYTAGGSGNVRNADNIELATLKDPKDYTAVANLQSKVHTLRTTNPGGEQTVNACRELLRMQPDASIFHVWLGDCLHNRGEFELAAKAYEDAIRCDERMFLAYNGLAMVTAVQGNLREALPLFQKAYSLRPGDPVIRDNIIKNLLHLANQENQNANRNEARQLCRQALELDPDNATAKAMLYELE